MLRLKIKRLIFPMASFFGRVSFLIFTFAFGTFATLFWQELVSPPTVSLCQLAQSPYFYAWRTVQVEADAYSFGAVFITDKTCRVPEVAAAGVWRADGYEPSTEVQKLYSESDTETYRARILITGRFDPDATPGCYVPRAAIRATRIELKSEITAEPIERRREQNKLQ